MYGVGSGSGAGVGGGFPHPGAPTPTGFTPGGNPIRQVVCVSVRACVRACMQAGHAYMRRAYAWTLRARCVALGQGSVDCPFYVKTGDCKFGATCKFNHPPEMFGVGAGGQGAAGLGAAGGARRRCKSPTQMEGILYAQARKSVSFMSRTDTASSGHRVSTTIRLSSAGQGPAERH